MVTKVTGGTPAHIFMPTHDQLVKTYGSIVEGAEKAHKLKKLSKAPAGAESYPKYDITKGLGVKREVYCIKGELYLKSTVVAPNAKPHWFKAGPAPLF